jgi:hypothetical protein
MWLCADPVLVLIPRSLARAHRYHRERQRLCMRELSRSAEAVRLGPYLQLGLTRPANSVQVRDAAHGSAM